MPRAVRGPLLIIVLIALLLAGLLFWIRTSVPKLEGRVELPGLAGTVEMTRDEFGVPTIEAGSQEDLYYALGFVHAQDRLWQMEHRRLQAAGRLAELLGEEALASDLLMRTLGLRRAAERDVARLSARVAGTLQAYSDGVNAYLATRSGALPLEFQLLGHTPEEWTPVDVALLQKLTAWEWSTAAADELLRARVAARLPRDRLEELLAIESALDKEVYGKLPLAGLFDLIAGSSGSFEGSQAWVLAGERTAGGVPLLAVEGRGPLTAPSPWYLVRLRGPGLSLAGATLPGLPLVLSGRNEEIAWALVPTVTDNADLYLERLVEPGDPSHGYRTEAGAREFDTRRELIEVRGADDVELLVRETVHGPVISGMVPSDGGTSAEQVLALSWSALHVGDGTLQAALALASASEWPEFLSALANLDELPGTALYADVQGRIGWHAVGRRPQRTPGSGELPGQGDAAVWDGWAPFTGLDGALLPAGGELVVGGAEAASIEQLLDSLAAHTVLSATGVLDEEFLPGTGTLLPLLSETVPTTELARRAHAHLLGWSGELGAGGVAPLVFSVWSEELNRELLSDELGADLASAASRYRLLPSPAEWCDDSRTFEDDTCAQLSSRALEAAVATLAERYGPQLSEWPTHPAARVSYGHRVFGGTLLAPLFRVAADADIDRDAPRAGTGPVYRAVYQLSGSGDWGSSGFLIPTGQSGNPVSPYYRNLAEPWSHLRLLPLLPAEADEDMNLLLEPRR